LILLAITACSKRQVEEDDTTQSTTFSGSEIYQRQKTKYLAYEHFVTVDIKEENILPAYKSTIEACINDTENNCTILDSRISSGKYPSAYIRLRIKPEGVKGIVAIASSKGKVIQESTHVEDLAKPVVDNKKRLKMLESHHGRLLLLQEKASNDIESLIKVSSELSKVQSELEQAMGENAFLLQRVNMDIVNINFQVKLSRSFWKPICRSLSSFSNNLSDGISGTIVAVAYLLPGLILIFLLFIFIRYLWRKLRKK
jgi:hypothetical protein